MKAILPTGEHLELPDGTSKEQATALVKSLLAARAKKSAQLIADEKKKRDMTDAQRHKKNIDVTHEIAKSTSAIIESLGKKLDSSSLALKELSSKLDPLKELVDAIEVFSSNVENLEKCIEKCSAEIIKVMKAPRKILTSQKGRPTGMQVGEE